MEGAHRASGREFVRSVTDPLKPAVEHNHEPLQTFWCADTAARHPQPDRRPVARSRQPDASQRCRDPVCGQNCRREIRRAVGGDRNMRTIESWLDTYLVVADDGTLVTAARRTHRLRTWAGAITPSLPRPRWHPDPVLVPLTGRPDRIRHPSARSAAPDGWSRRSRSAVLPSPHVRRSRHGACGRGCLGSACHPGVCASRRSSAPCRSARTRCGGTTTGRLVAARPRLPRPTAAGRCP
jgi:hypothetical protein